MNLRELSFVILGVVLTVALGMFRSTAGAQSTARSVAPVESSRITIQDGQVIHASDDPPLILTGDDLAVKVDHTREGRIVGTLMARVDGNWQPVELSSINALAK